MMAASLYLIHSRVSEDRDSSDVSPLVQASAAPAAGMTRFRMARNVPQGPRPPGTPKALPPLDPWWYERNNEERIFLLRAGNPQGAPVLFIHGIGGWAENWLPTLPVFRNFRCIIPDIPGFGRSSALPEVTHQKLIESLLRLLDAEGIERTMLVGNSLGGGLALRMALDYPDRFSHLVLATAAGIQKDIAFAFKLGLLPGIGEVALGHMRRIFELRWRIQFGNKALVTPDFLEELSRFSLEFDCRPTYLGLLRRSTGLLGLKDVVTDELSDLRQPTLLTWGTKDSVLPVAHGHFAAKRVPNIHFELFEGAGHYPHWEQPDRFNALVASQLQRWGLERSPAVASSGPA